MPSRGSTTKAVSALRADLEELLDSLLTSHRRKLSLIEDFARTLDDWRYYIKTEDTERLSSAVSESDALLELVDTIDYDIGAAFDRISSIAGIDRGDIEDMLRGSGHPGAAELLGIRSRIKRLIAGALKDYEAVIEEMERLSLKIRADADTLSHYRKLKPMAPP